MNEETKTRLRERFSRILDDDRLPDGDLTTVADLEALALRLREEIAQATLDEGGRELQEQADTPDAAVEASALESRMLVPMAFARSRGASGWLPSLSKMRCPHCHRQAWCKGRRSRMVVTLAGIVRLSRRYYYCRRCDQGHCPLDSRLGLSKDISFTPRLTQEVACLSACLPFEQAVQMLHRLTSVSVSARSAERLCLAQAGAQAEAFRADRDAQSLPLAFSDRASLPPTLPHPDVLYIEADGIQTPMKGGHWREMKVGVARSEHRDGRLAQASGYVNLLGEAETFGEYLESLAIHCGSLTAESVVFLGDGAAWLWKLASDRFPRAIQILDFWHALEYVAKVARDALVVSETERGAKGTLVKGTPADKWLSERALEMKKSDWARFYAALEAQRQKAPESVAMVVRYFGNNASRMDYARYLRMGLSIGSGLAESSCKRLVTQRLKGSGMHWSEAGAQAVCALRCLLLAGQWDNFTKFWNQATKAPQLSPLS